MNILALPTVEAGQVQPGDYMQVPGAAQGDVIADRRMMEEPGFTEPGRVAFRFAGRGRHFVPFPRNHLVHCLHGHEGRAYITDVIEGALARISTVGLNDNDLADIRNVCRLGIQLLSAWEDLPDLD